MRWLLKVRGRLVPLALLAVPFVVACGGESETSETTSTGSTSTGTGAGGGGGGDGSDLPPAEYFAEQVFPEFSLTCGACHTSEENCVPKFMAEESAPTYEMLKAFTGLVVPPDSSNLRLYGSHTGPALTATQDEKVKIWLQKEFPGDTGENSQLAALRALGDCMSEETFEASEFVTLAYQQTASAGPCGACHKTGEAGTWIGFNAADMFDKSRELPYIRRLVKARFEGATFVDLVPNTRLFDKPEYAAQCGERHPQAIIDPPRRFATETFIQDSLDAWRAGNCE